MRSLVTEKRNAHHNKIAEVECGGAVTSDKYDIEMAVFEYYSELFAASPVELERFKSEFLASMLRLDEEIKAFLEESITSDDVGIAIGALNLGKSPGGPDGISAGFYKAMKGEIAPVPPVYTKLYKIIFAKRCSKHRPGIRQSPGLSGGAS